VRDTGQTGKVSSPSSVRPTPFDFSGKKNPPPVHGASFTFFKLFSFPRCVTKTKPTEKLRFFFFFSLFFFFPPLFAECRDKKKVSAPRPFLLFFFSYLFFFPPFFPPAVHTSHPKFAGPPRGVIPPPPPFFFFPLISFFFFFCRATGLLFSALLSAGPRPDFFCICPCWTLLFFFLFFFFFVFFWSVEKGMCQIDGHGPHSCHHRNTLAFVFFKPLLAPQFSAEKHPSAYPLLPPSLPPLFSLATHLALSVSSGIAQGPTSVQFFLLFPPPLSSSSPHFFLFFCRRHSFMKTSPWWSRGFFLFRFFFFFFPLFFFMWALCASLLPTVCRSVSPPPFFLVDFSFFLFSPLFLWECPPPIN